MKTLKKDERWSSSSDVGLLKYERQCLLSKAKITIIVMLPQGISS